jgi:hypothetical protein
MEAFDFPKEGAALMILNGLQAFHIIRKNFLQQLAIKKIHIDVIFIIIDT